MLTLAAAFLGTLLAHAVVIAVGVLVARRDRRRRAAALADIQREAAAMLEVLGTPGLRALRREAVGMERGH
jgi:hypothetical protein